MTDIIIASTADTAADRSDDIFDDLISLDPDTSMSADSLMRAASRAVEMRDRGDELTAHFILLGARTHLIAERAARLSSARLKTAH